MNKPIYLNLDQARTLLAEMGVELNERQMQRAAERDARGNRRLPFFVDPIEGKLKIERQTLINLYRQRQIEAERRLNL